MRHFIRSMLFVSALTMTHLGFAQGDKYPTKPIQGLITAPPGSTSDVLTRFLGAEMSKTLGQPFVVISKASASGTIGADLARRAAPDAYTLYHGANTTIAANVHIYMNLS